MHMEKKIDVITEMVMPVAEVIFGLDYMHLRSII